MISGGFDMGGSFRGGSMGARGGSSWRGSDEFAEVDPDAKRFDQNVVRRMLPFLTPIADSSWWPPFLFWLRLALPWLGPS